MKIRKTNKMNSDGLPILELNLKLSEMKELK